MTRVSGAYGHHHSDQVWGVFVLVKPAYITNLEDLVFVLELCVLLLDLHLLARDHS